MSKNMYNKRKCKECKKVFEKKQPLQYVCSPINYQEKYYKLDKNYTDIFEDVKQFFED
jgi:hypothetical protein